MREILFRAKRKDNGQWVCGSYHYEHGFGNPKHYIAYYVTFGGFTSCELVEIDENTLGQYTGLKDKNGNKIFDGDIVHVILENNKPKRDFISYVIWSDTCCEFRLNDYDYFMDSNTYGMEVIGNIHDNPELLKGK